MSYFQILHTTLIPAGAKFLKFLTRIIKSPDIQSTITNFDDIYFQ